MKKVKTLFSIICLVLLSSLLFVGCKGGNNDNNTAVYYTITFNTCGGNLIDSVEVKENSLVSKPINPTKEHYKFISWYSDENYNIEFVFETTKITKDTTLYAKWKSNLYTITYHLNGGENNNNNPNTFTINDNIQLLDAQKTGYTFHGWYTESNFENKIEVVNQNNLNNLNLYAKFVVNQHTISFVTNGGQELDPITLNYGETINLPNPIKQNYTFDYWYIDNQNKFNLTTMPDYNITIYAKWKVKVELFVDNELAGVVYTDDVNDYKIQEPLKPEDITSNPTIEKYFYGWYTDPLFQNPYSNTTTFTVNSKLYAKWVTVYIDSFRVYYEQGIASIAAFFKSTEIIVIPAYIGTFPVKSIGGFSNNQRVKEVIICNGVEEISDNAFGYCTSLKKIHLPSSINTIGSSAFEGCGLLEMQTKGNVSYLEGSQSDYEFAIKAEPSATTITIDNDCRVIADKFDSGVVHNLESIFVEEGNVNYFSLSGVLYKKNPTKMLSFPKKISGEIEIPTGVTDIDNNLFKNYDKITKIILPNTITEIKDYQFSNCSSLEEVIMANSIQTIGSSAFYNCVLLKEIIIPNSVQTIGSSAFYNCELLKEIIVPNSVQTIGSAAFQNCSSLIKLSVPFVGASRETTRDLSSDVSPYVFGYIFGYGIINAETNRGPSYGYEHASNTKILTYFGQPYYQLSGNTNGLSTIYRYSYYGYYVPSSLKEVYITDATGISEKAFYNCDNIEIIKISGNVTFIDNKTFYKCTNLIDIDLPNSVEYIDDDAFYECLNFTNIKLPSGLNIITSLYSTNFKNITINNSYVYNLCSGFDSCEGLFKNATTIKVLKSIVDDISNTNEFLNGSSFIRTEEENYYIYTKINQE